MKTNNKKVEDKFYGKRIVKGIFAKSWSGKSAKLNKYGDYAIVAADADGNAKGFANRTQAQNFSDSNNLGGVKDPSGGGRSFYVYIKDPSSEEKKTLSRTGSKARFAKEYILWALPKGETDRLHERPIAERLYTDAQINEAKLKATAAGWHSFRVVEEMSFEDMTNLWKGKPVKRRSSRTGSKARFANEEIARGLSKVLKANGFNAMASEVLSGSTDSETLRKYIRALKSKMSPMSSNERGMILLQTLEKQLASRTGTKTMFDKEWTEAGFSASFFIKKLQGMMAVYQGENDNEYRNKIIGYAKTLANHPDFVFNGVSSQALAKKAFALVKFKYARQGFKAKFSHLSTMLDMLDYQSANDQEDLAKKNIKGLAQSIGKLNPTKDEWSRYVKIAKSLGFSESQISGFARTGLKVFK